MGSKARRWTEEQEEEGVEEEVIICGMRERGALKH